MELWHVFDKTRCNRSACRPHLQVWAGHHYHQSNTTVHLWSSYSELQDTTQYNYINILESFFERKISYGWLLMLLCYLCNVLPAWSHDGYTLHTGHKDSPLGHGPSHKVVSTVTSGRGDSSCSGSSLPYGVPCPCL